MEKTVRKTFFAWQYEKEEKWLNQMSSEGWQLEHAALLKYHFKKSEPGEYEYKLELLDKDTKSKESRAYMDFLKQTEAEIVGEVSTWIYLRKKKSAGGFDGESRMVNRLTMQIKVGEIYQGFLMFFLILIAVSVVGIMIFHPMETSTASSFLEGFFTGIILGGSLFSVLLIPVIRRNQKKIRKALQEVVVAERA